MAELSTISNQKSRPGSADLESAKRLPFFKPFIQAKLSVNEPADTFEQNANAVSNKIMSQPVHDNSFFKPVCNIIQKAPTVEGTKSTNASYELNSNGQQTSTSGTSAFADAKLSYDGTNFNVEFAMAWIFPHGWDDAKRDTYVKGFEDAVKNAWNNKFLLKETGTQRTAHVNISFDENVVHQLADAFDEAMALDKILKAKSVWTMDTRQINIRSNVSGTNVHLDEDANKTQTRKGKDVVSGAPLVVHDGNENKTFTQVTSAHEFGHMIGLGDEYINDNGTPLSQLSAARAHVNNRIMNVGDKVTNDVYQPFADWLSTLTKTTWTVGGKP